MSRVKLFMTFKENIPLLLEFIFIAFHSFLKNQEIRPVPFLEKKN